MKIWAAGGVVWRIVEGRVDVVLLGTPEPVQWRLPKGIRELNESLEDAAVREVHEETGLETHIQQHLLDVSWSYVHNGEPC